MMTWQEIVNNQDLANFPFKIETNEFGQVVMSPRKYIHGIYQAHLASLLEQFLTNGITSTETAIATRKGVKVPDVAWSSYAFFNAHRDELELSEAPELCAEIISPSNTVKEISSKRKLFFERGALEVWTCDLNGNMCFYDVDGELEVSKLAPEFPKSIEIKVPKT
jgi:Uma2 family endonuclease